VYLFSKESLMQLTLDIPEQDFAEFGKETIRSEIEKMIKWLKIK